MPYASPDEAMPFVQSMYTLLQSVLAQVLSFFSGEQSPGNAQPADNATHAKVINEAYGTRENLAHHK